jgi:SAM-dependent methyltransferase
MAFPDITISTQVHDTDQMFTGNLARYLSVGRDAASKIPGVTESMGLRPASVLDYGSGFGRVGRYFSPLWPEADIHYADLMTPAAQFCADTFGGRAHTVGVDFTAVQLDRSFDLIWSGSVMTHVDELRASQMIAMFLRHLNPGGLAIWTTHGRYLQQLHASGKWPYSLSSEQFGGIVARFDAGGYGYVDYAHMKGYGISMTPLPWLYDIVRKMPDVQITTLIERGWDNHLDIFALRRI